MGYCVPFHTKQFFEDLGVGLAINSMQGNVITRQFVNANTLQAGSDDKETLMKANRSNKGILLIIPIIVDGITCCTLIDTGAGSLYASGKLTDSLKKKPCQTKTKQVDMLVSSQVTRLEVYNTLIESLDGNFTTSVSS